MPLTYSSLSSSPSPLSSSTSPPSSGNKLSPPLVFTIVTLSCVVFISGLILFLYRFLKRYRSSLPMSQSNRNPDMSTSDALQRQLQQLFHLHDSGLDQAFIDSLPMFVYNDIKGQKEPFDCAVCLCEFSEQDKLRLLPLCGHAFHIDCIDTWLLSNSTCPLCRGLLSTPGFSIENPADFDLDDSRYEDGLSGNASIAITSEHQKPAEDDHHHNVVTAKRVFSVRLGKFVRTTNDGRDQGDDQMIKEVGETSHEMINLDARRCYSMGSFQYVVASSDLEVATLCPNTARSCNGVENGGDVTLQMRDGNSTANSLTNDHGDVNGKKISMRTKGESFSISKIWLWSKKDRLSSATNSHISSSVNVRLPRFSPNGDNKQ